MHSSRGLTWEGWGREAQGTAPTVHAWSHSCLGWVRGPARGWWHGAWGQRWQARGPRTAHTEAINTDGPGMSLQAGRPRWTRKARLLALSEGSFGAVGSGSGCCPLGQRKQRRKDTQPLRWDWRRLEFWQFGFPQAPGAVPTALAGEGKGRGLARPRQARGSSSSSHTS